MRRVAFVSMVVMVVVASGCADPDTTDYDPVGRAAVEANMELVVAPPEQVTSCVESTKFGAFVGDASARARWDAAEQSDAALSDLCIELGRTDSDALASIHWDWTAAQSALDAALVPGTAPATD